MSSLGSASFDLTAKIENSEFLDSHVTCCCERRKGAVRGERKSRGGED